MALFSTISWCLWQRRNRLRENQPTWPLKEVGERAIVLVREIFDACKSDVVPEDSLPFSVEMVEAMAALFAQGSCLSKE